MDNLCNELEAIKLEENRYILRYETSNYSSNYSSNYGLNNTPQKELDENDSEIYSIINSELEELANYYYMWKKNRGEFCFMTEYNPKLEMYIQDKHSVIKIQKYLNGGNNALNIVVNKIYEKNPTEIIDVSIVNYLLKNYYTMNFTMNFN